MCIIIINNLQLRYPQNIIRYKTTTKCTPQLDNTPRGSINNTLLHL